MTHDGGGTKRGACLGLQAVLSCPRKCGGFALSREPLRYPRMGRFLCGFPSSSLTWIEVPGWVFAPQGRKLC
jgi:hypothetical protein